jgi:hypothetical protein
MKRLALAVAATATVVTASHAAPTKVPLEMWGLEANDEVSIDGASVNVRSGGAARTFAGDPDATNAPVLHELTPGRHEITVRRGGCAPRDFTVTLESGSKRAVIFEAEDLERCALPLAPPRR